MWVWHVPIVRLRCAIISLTLIYLIKLGIWKGKEITSIDLFDQNKDVVCANVILRCS